MDAVDNFPKIDKTASIYEDRPDSVARKLNRGPDSDAMKAISARDEPDLKEENEESELDVAIEEEKWSKRAPPHVPNRERGEKLARVPYKKREDNYRASEFMSPDDENRRERKRLKRRSGRYEKRYRNRTDDRRSSGKERGRTKYQVMRESEESYSEDEEMFSSDDSADSDESSARSTRESDNGLARKDVRSKRDKQLYKSSGNRSSKQRKSSKKNSPYKGYDPHVVEKGGGRSSRRYVPSPVYPGSTELLGQMLLKQDMMLTKLDSMISLLRKTVRALTRSQNQPGYQNGDLDSSRSWRKRSRGPASDSGRNSDGYERHISVAKKQRHRMPQHEPIQSEVANRNMVDGFIHGGGAQGTPQQMERPRIYREGGRMNEELQPMIASYYSVSEKGLEARQQVTYSEEYRNTAAGNTPKSSAKNQTDHQPNASPRFERSGTNIVSHKLGINPQIISSMHAFSLAQIKQQPNSSTGSFVRKEDTEHQRGDKSANGVQLEATNEMQPVLPIGRSSSESPRNLKLDARPSMVNLSQANSTVIPHKFYAQSNTEGYSQSNSLIEQSELNDDSFYGDDTIPCVFPGQAWQEEDSRIEAFKSSFVDETPHRRRDSLELVPWLSRTFTTGSGQSDGHGFMANGKESKGMHKEIYAQLDRRGESTDNKKMMSNITHLTFTTINVSSETVQVLIATPSDHNNDRDAPRKSMERVLNQSLALMNCLPLIAEIDLSVVQKIYNGSKNCMTFIYRLMDHCYTREELMKCRVAGGVRKYRGNNTETEQLCPKRLRTILKLANDLYQSEYAQLSKANMIRNNINMKCRKTVIRDMPDND